MKKTLYLALLSIVIALTLGAIPAALRHNKLDGLQGGTTDEYYHITQTENTNWDAAYTHSLLVNEHLDWTDASVDLMTSGNVKSGASDTTAGVFKAYGAGTGGTDGGCLQLHTAADYDTSIDVYQINIDEDDLVLKQGTTTKLTLSGATGNFTFTGAGHDSFTDFAANEHIDWTNSSGNDISLDFGDYTNFGNANAKIGAAVDGILRLEATEEVDINCDVYLDEVYKIINPLSILRHDVITDGVTDIAIEHMLGMAQSPENGIGIGLSFMVQDAGGSEEQGSIDVVLTDVTDDAECADMVFSLNIDGDITEMMRLDASAGALDLLSYDIASVDEISSIRSIKFTDSGGFSSVDEATTFMSMSGIAFYFTAVNEQLLTITNPAFGVSTVKVNINKVDADFIVSGDNETNLLFTDGSTDRVGIGISSPTALLHIDQSSDSGAIPVLRLDQADVDDSFVDFIGTSAADATKSISTLTTSGATTHHIKCEINGVSGWIAFSTNDPS